MGWRDFQSKTIVELMEKKEKTILGEDFIPLIPFIPHKRDSEIPVYIPFDFAL